MSADARTTPRALRLPVLVLLVALAGYFFNCWQNALGEGEPSFARWFATWQMFTLRDPGHAILYGEAEVDGAWQPIDLEKLFPTRWESGPRYARSAFWQSPTKMRVFAAATCGRLPVRPRRVRFHAERFKKTLGQLTQPKRGLKKQDLIEWYCDRPVPLPQGTLL
jgi:hypothetical protein